MRCQLIKIWDFPLALYLPEGAMGSGLEMTHFVGGEHNDSAPLPRGLLTFRGSALVRGDFRIEDPKQPGAERTWGRSHFESIRASIVKGVNPRKSMPPPLSGPILKTDGG